MILSTVLGYFFIAAVPAAILAGLYAPICIAVRRRRGIPALRQYTCLALACVGVVIIFATLFAVEPNFGTAGTFNMRPFDWVNDLGRDGVEHRIWTQLIANALMFLPLGTLLPMVFPGLRRFWKTTAVVLAATCMIECTQFFIGRSGDIDDILVNLLGGMVGYLLFKALYALLKNRAWGQRMLGERAEPVPEGTGEVIA